MLSSYSLCCHHRCYVVIIVAMLSSWMLCCHRRCFIAIIIVTLTGILLFNRHRCCVVITVTLPLCHYALCHGHLCLFVIIIVVLSSSSQCCHRLYCAVLDFVPWFLKSMSWCSCHNCGFVGLGMEGGRGAESFGGIRDRLLAFSSSPPTKELLMLSLLSQLARLAAVKKEILAHKSRRI